MCLLKCSLLGQNSQATEFHLNVTEMHVSLDGYVTVKYFFTSSLNFVVISKTYLNIGPHAATKISKFSLTKNKKIQRWTLKRVAGAA